MKKILCVLMSLCIITAVACAASDELESGGADISNESVLEGVTDDMSIENVSNPNAESVSSKPNISPESNSPEESSQLNESSDSEESSRPEESRDPEESSQPDEPSQQGYSPLNYDYMKAVWLTQFDTGSVYKVNGSQRDKKTFTELFSKMLDNLKNDGYNTIIVQVRPNADSFYPSEYYPVSIYVSGAYGVESIYDPFEIIVSLAHERGFSVHAWLNPMRAMKPTQITSVPDRYPIKQWYNDPIKREKYLVELNGQLYLNPAYEEVRNLIASGAKEVCEKYDVDGVHIDDYFYPTTDASFDKLSYDEYLQNGGSKSLDQFRYGNIDLMVSEMYDAIKSVNKSILFGISPEGNIDNTYYRAYTDVYKWCSSNEYLDYICPQIYFGLEHQTHDFKKIFGVWKNIIKNPNIRYAVGMTLGKADSGIDNYAGSGKNEWAENKDIMKRCLEYLATQESCSGVSIFSYQFMYDALTGQSDPDTFEERKNMKPALEALK